MFPYINLNIKVYLIIIQITICTINCADYHLSDHDENIYSYQIVTLIHNTVVYMYLHSYKIKILILY